MPTFLLNCTTHIRSTSVIVLLAALLVGCAGEPPTASSTSTQESSSLLSAQESGSIGSRGSPTLGLTLDETFQVIDMQRGSAAEQAGIQRGDVLAEIEFTPLEAGTPPSSLLTLVQNLISQTQQAVPLTLLRGGQEIVITVLPMAPASMPNQPTPTAVPADQVYF